MEISDNTKYGLLGFILTTLITSATAIDRVLGLVFAVVALAAVAIGALFRALIRSQDSIVQGRDVALTHKDGEIERLRMRVADLEKLILEIIRLSIPLDKRVEELIRNALLVEGEKKDKQ